MERYLDGVLVFLLKRDPLRYDREQALEVEVASHVVEHNDLRVGRHGLVGKAPLEVKALTIDHR